MLVAKQEPNRKPEENRNRGPEQDGNQKKRPKTENVLNRPSSNASGKLDTGRPDSRLRRQKAKWPAKAKAKGMRHDETSKARI